MLSVDKASNILSLLYHMGISTFQPDTIIYFDLKLIDSPFQQDITQVCYIAASMLVGAREQEIATALDSLVRHLCVKGWKIDHTKGRGLLYQ